MPTVLKLLRPSHWIKNLFVLAAVLFSRRLTQPVALVGSLLAVVCFCLLASAVYVFNDLCDRAADKSHPRKALRPIASGKVGARTATAVMVLLLVAGLAGAVAVGLWTAGGQLRGLRFAIVAGCYVLLNVLYSLRLKRAVLVDVICIAAGFVLRALAGAVLIDVVFSPWLLVCTFSLTLFVALGKRRCELAAAGGTAGVHRRVNLTYTAALLDQLLTVTAAVTLLAYLLYTIQRAPVLFTATGVYLLYTSPLVFYGLFRFLMLAQQGRYDGPVEIILGDMPFVVTVVLWAVAVVVIIYVMPWAFALS